MKIAVSNIAWKPLELYEHLKLLKELDCTGVEIAPSLIWKEPILASKKERFSLLKMVNRYSLTIVAMHALTYTHPELKMFDTKESRDLLKEYLFKMINLAHDLKCPVMVFGSPQSRRVEKQKYDECLKIAVDFFYEIGEYARSRAVNFCIEPLGPSDNCDFIMNTDEAYKLIQMIGSKGFGLHLDTKTIINNTEDYEKVFNQYGKVLKHFHVGDPGIRPPVSDEHVKIGKALKKSQYNNYVSIEMRRGFGPQKEVITKAVRYVTKCYIPPYLVV